MSDEKIKVKVEISLDDRLETINKNYTKIVGEIKQIEDQIQKNHQQLTTVKNDKMQKGLELQGQIKLLVDMGAKPKEAPKVEEKKVEKKEEAKK